MRELSLHILDVVQNSIAAEATLVQIRIEEDTERDRLVIEIEDNGKGMDPDMVRKVTDPFVTSRTTRKVGLGLSLFKAAAESCDGYFEIESEVGKGTRVKAVFRHSHIDRVPLGNMVDTVYSLIVLNPDVDIVYSHGVDGRHWVLDTRDVKRQLDLDTLSHPEVLNWVREYLVEGMKYIYEEG